MDILKAYANRVVSYLPAKQRTPLRDELYANLYDEWQDSQQAAEQFIQQKPHPIRFATSLSQEPGKYLIGPEFYISYIEVLKGAAGVIGLLFLLLGVVQIGSSGQFFGPLFRTLAELVNTLVWMSVLVTLVFMALQRHQIKASWLDQWSVGDLQAWESNDTISRGTIGFDLAMSALMIGWLCQWIPLPILIWHDQQLLSDWQLSIHDVLWFALLLLLALDVLKSLWQMTNPIWTRFNKVSSLTLNLGWIALLLIIWHSDTALILSMEQAEAYADIQGLANRVFDWGLLGICALVIWDTLTLLFKSMNQRFASSPERH